ncbi:MAG: lipoprotein [Bauldia sp.]|nr:lipoprotein [Bauldia sp.]MCW5716191.1 lipoprotein [Bauldia sp.]
MTGSRRPSMVAVLALTVMAMALAGCGRKGPLEPPPSRATTDAVVTTGAPPPAGSVP